MFLHLTCLFSIVFQLFSYHIHQNSLKLYLLQFTLFMLSLFPESIVSGKCALRPIDRNHGCKCTFQFALRGFENLKEDRIVAVCHVQRLGLSRSCNTLVISVDRYSITSG